MRDCRQPVCQIQKQMGKYGFFACERNRLFIDFFVLFVFENIGLMFQIS